LTPRSGLLHRRFAVPSLLPDFSRTAGTRHPLARTRLFAASLPLVLKSLIRSAALTASLNPPAVISSQRFSILSLKIFGMVIGFQASR